MEICLSLALYKRNHTFTFQRSRHRFPEDTIKIKHIKGHQDSDRSTHLLSWPAQLNVIADRSANTFLQTMSQSKPTPFSHLPRYTSEIPKTTSLSNVGIFISAPSAITKNTHNGCAVNSTGQPPLSTDIDFDGLHATIWGLPTYQLRFVMKWINQALPVRCCVHRYDRHIPPSAKHAPKLSNATPTSSNAPPILAALLATTHTLNCCRTSSRNSTRTGSSPNHHAPPLLRPTDSNLLITPV